ncbi:MAG: low molecular weight phosphotyrosine protein phosphatase [Chlamydiales bacterium]|nr:low molecular weight phosphotyrosine protein phosphatase [Chlamydiia bacterium]MCP5507201.1 low molecular weight phosphotyrosine protein phosphatase [Chlamydiales bacterium]
MARVLFVCLGNICRSPAGEGVLKRLAEQRGVADKIHVESCGIGDWHVGQLPDQRMRDAAGRRGIVLGQRAQQLSQRHLDEFDFILAADHEVYNDLHRYAKNPHHKSKIYMMTEFSKVYEGQEVPDPYYGDIGDFELVLDMLHDACEGLLNRIENV